MTYLFKYRRGRYFWRSVRVTGHRYETHFDKMVLFYSDGSLEEIALWSDCDLILGPDWMLAVKKVMEDKAGQAIPLAKDVHAAQ